MESIEIPVFLEKPPGTKSPTECLYFMETKATVSTRYIFRGGDLQALSDQLFASFMGLKLVIPKIKQTTPRASSSA